jgi:hypothetical protein
MTFYKKLRAAISITGSAFLLSGCMQGESGDGCTSKSDCEHGLLCVRGLSGSTCKPGCDHDGDCAAGSICATGFALSLGEPDGKCVQGCRIDDQCASGETCRYDHCVRRCDRDAQCADGDICDDGACHSGCRKNDQCAPGNVCVQNVCIEGECAAREDCAAGDECVCQKCVPGCHDDAACPSGSYCDQKAGLTCAPPACQELPSAPEIGCGGATCAGYSLVRQYVGFGVIGRRAVVLTPCCLPDDRCGIDFSGLVAGQPSCQEPVFDFTASSACSGHEDPFGPPLGSCARQDGSCGLVVSVPDGRSACFTP